MLLRILHGIGIYPHDGKSVIFEQDGKLHVGRVFGPGALTGQTKDETVRLQKVVEAADGLRLPPFRIEQRLRRGKKVVFRPRGSR